MKKLFLNILSQLSLVMAASGISECSKAGICQKEDLANYTSTENFNIFLDYIFHFNTNFLSHNIIKI